MRLRPASPRSSGPDKAADRRSATAARRRWIALAILAGVAALGLGALAGGWLVSSGPLAPAKPSPAPGSAPSGFTVFRDRGAGFSIAYPRDWRRMDSADPDVRLIAAPGRRAGRASSGPSLLIRVVELPVAVGARDLPRVRRLTRGIVTGGRRVEILEGPRALRLGGLPGHHYLYTFRDRDTGRRGVHSHYFLFDGRMMITLVFQSLPQGRFRPLAPTFDRIARTFRATP